MEDIACRVGSGISINVRNDPWLPDTQNPYVSSSDAILDTLMVFSLIVTGENRWIRTWSIVCLRRETCI